MPAFKSFLIKSESRIFFLPINFPLARALARPIFTLSAMRSLSNWAMRNDWQIAVTQIEDK